MGFARRKGRRSAARAILRQGQTERERESRRIILSKCSPQERTTKYAMFWIIKLVRGRERERERERERIYMRG